VGAALEGGTQEIVLTGVHLGSWGQEFDQPLHLRHLVETILKETDTPRLRLSSLEPWDLDADFFALWQDSRLCRHLHLPLQSGSRSVLKRMLRHTTPESFRDLVAAARQVMPQVAITTDVIAGFPGETEAEFAETLEFIREMDFAGGHVFTYSPRPGTPAARMKGQLPKEVRKARNAALRGAFAEMETVFRRRFLGQALSVLWEASAQMDERGWQMQGLTDNYLRVSATAPAPRWNRIDAVRLSGLSDRGLTGEILRLS
jgi:threonylcarbamoyladenosine tRNA methylthiotransferase MtaB